MQLFALTIENEVVAANDALKKTEYSCMECGKPVRLRGGRHRQDHFYHLRPDPSCKQSQKSMRHLQVQLYLHRLLSDGEVALERRFPTISRIADVVWEDRKLVFEVQCSPITQQEVEARNRDYALLGYQVVWLLHERRFSGKQVSAAEQWLEDHPHYYTNFDEEGRGKIYDQLHLFRDGIRRYSTKQTTVNLSTLTDTEAGISFQGDWRYRQQLGEQEAVEVWELWKKERELLFPEKRFNLIYEVKRWYLNLLGLMLEASAKKN